MWDVTTKKLHGFGIAEADCEFNSYDHVYVGLFDQGNFVAGVELTGLSRHADDASDIDLIGLNIGMECYNRRNCVRLVEGGVKSLTNLRTSFNEDLLDE